MKKLAITFLAVVAVLALTRHAQALQGTLATKQITVNFTVTPSPSPTPVAYVPVSEQGRISFASLLTRADSSNQVAYDPLSLSEMVAQATPQGGVKVQFTVKADPSFQYFHVVPGPSMSSPLSAGYGANNFPCVYQVFAKYSTAWTVTDYAYGSNTSGGTAGLNGFPMYNYAAKSDLSWLAETVTTSFKPFANSGQPGETTFTGAAGAAKTICIDLSLTVPNNVPAGDYQATISYRMTHN